MRFQIKAVDSADAVVSLEFQAQDEDDARQQAATQGYTVLAVRSDRHVGWPFAQRHKAFPLLFFSQELHTLLEAGLSLVEALEGLSAKERNPAAKKIVRRLIEILREGKSFSHALRQSPAVFPALYVAAVSASEKTGDLGDALSRYIAYRTQVDLVKRKILTSSIYPLLLLGVGGMVVMFLMFYVVPRFSHVYEDVGRGKLPLLSQWLMAWGSTVEAHAALILGAIALAVGACVWAVTTGRAAAWIEDRLWRVPSLHERLLAYQLSRFYRTVGMLLRGGVPLVTAMSMTSGLLRPALRAGLARAVTQVSAGRPISQVMEAEHLATPVALRMLAVGERAGNMGEMMERIAVFHEQEIAHWLDWFTRMFEPLLMAVIGLVIGGIVILMYMPIFDLAGNIR